MFLYLCVVLRPRSEPCIPFRIFWIISIQQRLSLNNLNEQTEHLTQRSTNIDHYLLLYTNIPSYFRLNFPQTTEMYRLNFRGYNLSHWFSSNTLHFCFSPRGKKMVTVSTIESAGLIRWTAFLFMRKFMSNLIFWCQSCCFEVLIYTVRPLMTVIRVVWTLYWG